MKELLTLGWFIAPFALFLFISTLAHAQTSVQFGRVTGAPSTVCAYDQAPTRNCDTFMSVDDTSHIVTIGAGVAPGAFTTLTSTSPPSGAGFTSLFANPPPLGSTARNTGAFTTLSTLASTSPFAINTYGSGNDAVAAHSFLSTDSAALNGTQRYTMWVGNTSAGTGDGTVPGTTNSLVVSNIKANWQTTAVPGQALALTVVARGGHNNALNSGDTAAININAGSSYSNNFVNQLEGVSGYYPAGSTTGSLSMNTQVGSIRATGLDTASNTGIGFYAVAQNGLLGYAFQANNMAVNPLYGTASKWLGAFNYIYDDGTHTPYSAFKVNQTGSVVLAGFGTAGTNEKRLRVGGSVINNFEIVNAPNTSVILSLTDTGDLAFDGTLNAKAGGMLGDMITDTIGFYGATKVSQRAAGNNAVVPVGGTGTAAGGWDTAAHRDTAIATINEIRTTLINLGLMPAT